MDYIKRRLERRLEHSLERGKSVLLLGARQTGKTTLVNRFDADLTVSFVAPDVRQRYEKSPHLLRGEVEALPAGKQKKLPLVVLDEVQRVPTIMDVVQDLIDRRKALFILTGSSARKLVRSSHMNLLPGRVAFMKLDPFNLSEAPRVDLEELLLYGSLPGTMATATLRDREEDLESYVTTYLEAEVRAEAVVRNLGHFARFLELAASESGELVNLRKLSQEIGVAHTTIGAYYQILEDCLIVERFDPLTESKTRKKLTKSARYLFFDLGVRRIAAREGTRLSRETMGKLFEQFVGLELLRHVQAGGWNAKIRFWRDPDGPEVDWVIEDEGEFVPIEVKWTEQPTAADIRHLEVFLDEYPTAKEGFVICRTPRKLRLSQRIVALPWHSLPDLFKA